MSTELRSVGSINVTQFWGGNERKVCLQLTGEGTPGYVQITVDEAGELAQRLSEWHRAHAKVEKQDAQAGQGETTPEIEPEEAIGLAVEAIKLLPQMAKQAEATWQLQAQVRAAELELAECKRDLVEEQEAKRGMAQALADTETALIRAGQQRDAAALGCKLGLRAMRALGWDEAEASGSTAQLRQWYETAKNALGMMPPAE